MSSRDPSDVVSRVIHYLVDHVDEQPGLADLAAHVEQSPSHLQRTFQRQVGVSPKRFLQYMTVEHAKSLLSEDADVLQTSLEVGLSGPGRLHDHFVALEAVTPGEWKDRGSGLEIRYGVADSPFGEVFLASTDRGVCQLAFPRSAPERTLVEREHLRRWSGARLTADPGLAHEVSRRIFGRPTSSSAPLAVLVRGTNFQVRVWRALLEIPAGAVCSYGQIAARVGATPGAAQAVGQAVGANPVAWLIPCHRVIRASGGLGGYRWGLARKRTMIALDSALSYGSPI
jgi:AraC family transcriptional regulator, regulatory protein of adaptative response / methylated-DNA-[protein]-cysteine methyltransferase